MENNILEFAKKMSKADLDTYNYITRHCADIVAEIRAIGYAEGKKAAVEEGAKAERERILGVWAQREPGHEALIDSLLFDGYTTGGQAAVAILNTERKLRSIKQEDYKDYF